MNRLLAMFVVLLSFAFSAHAGTTATPPGAEKKWITLLLTEDTNDISYTFRALKSRSDVCGHHVGERWVECTAHWDTLLVNEALLPHEQEFIILETQHVRMTKEAYCSWHKKDMLAVHHRVATSESCDAAWENFIKKSGFFSD